MSRIIVFLGAAAGLMHNDLWYFPLLMFLGGVAAVVYDFRWLHGPVGGVASRVQHVVHIMTGKKKKQKKNTNTNTNNGNDDRTSEGNAIRDIANCVSF